MKPNTIGNLVSVTDWLAAVTIPGIACRSLRNIPEGIQPQDAPLVAPTQSEPFMSEFTLKRLTMRDSANGRRYEVHYNLHYVLYLAATAEDVTWYEKLPDLADAWSNVITAWVDYETPTDAYDIRPSGTPGFGFVQDMANTQFYGVKFILSVTEFD